MRRYASEFDVSEIPGPVKRWVFPVVVALGRVLGKYRKFADAPPPIHADPRPETARGRAPRLANP